jgi:hypothetical protein
VTSDVTIYAGLFVIGLFATALGFLLWPHHWRWVVVAYVALMAWLVNLSAIAVYRNRPLPSWRMSLARVALRPAGFGGPEGKPLTTAHGTAPARTAIAVCAVVSVIVVALVTLAAVYR